MQEQNTISIDYLEEPARFADLINGYVYQGQELVRPEDVRELSGTVARISKKKKGKQIIIASGGEGQTFTGNRKI